MSVVCHSVSFSDDPAAFISDSSSPSGSQGKMDVAQTLPLGLIDSNLPSEAIVQLALAKAIGAGRRAVIFSPRNQTKIFNSSDSIIPLSSDPPPSIRSYRNADLPRTSSPFTPPPSDLRDVSETPSIIRSILKRKVCDTRVAATVEEGTLNNKEPARLVVTGKRPRIIPRDSFQLAVLRNAAGDGVGESSAAPDFSAKGKEKMPDEHLGSDDSNNSGDTNDNEAGEDDISVSSEEEEEVEENGELALGSLVTIIIEGAQDLLTLEEAYGTLMTRLRQCIPPTASKSSMSPTSKEKMRLATQPLRDQAPAMVRALLRDLARLLGEMPEMESSSGASSIPFGALKPIQVTPPTTNRSRLTPSPTPVPSSKKKPAREGSPRQGYTESEVRYRREASGVGAATLRFLAFTFNSPHLYTCFTEADLTSLLNQILRIAQTPNLPTPNAKKSHHLMILTLAQLRLPLQCVASLKSRIAKAVSSALSDRVGSIGHNAPKETKNQGFCAVSNLVSTYPTIFFAEYEQILPLCLRGMTCGVQLLRNKASAAAATFAATKLNLLADRSSREAWTKAKSQALGMERFVASHFKSAYDRGNASATIHNNAGEKKTEWTELDKVLKDYIGTPNGVMWACATWAIIATLLGSNYAHCGFSAKPNGLDHIMDRSLQASSNAVRPVTARVAWNHAIHAYLRSYSSLSLSDNQELIQSFPLFTASTTNVLEERIRTISTPFDYAMTDALDLNNVKRKLVNGHWKWERVERPRRFKWMETSGCSSASIAYAFTGMALYHQEQPAKERTAVSGLLSSDGPPVPEDDIESARLERLDQTWEMVLRPMLKSLSAVCGVDRLKVQGWSILSAMTSQIGYDGGRWTLDRLLSTRYLSGELFGAENGINAEAFLPVLEDESIQPMEIPPWGPAWISSRLESVLEHFQEAMTGISGLDNLSVVEWIQTSDGTPIMPDALAQVWTNVLEALATQQSADDNTTFTNGLGLVLRNLLQIFNRDPAAHIPLCELTSDNKPSRDADTIRLSLFSYLLDGVMDVLGAEVVGAIRIVLVQPSSVDQFIVKMAFGTDQEGHATMAGSLLGQLLRSSHQVLNLPLNDEARSIFRGVVSKILDVGSVQGLAGRLLGDITNVMPFVFPAQEALRLDVWRILALKWTEIIDLQPGATVNSTNHTGALLVTLLSLPFCEGHIDSTWHQHAYAEDLKAWQALLKVTVLRFRAKKVGSNFGVLESLAGHLTDFLAQGEKTSTTTITLSCLASAISWMSFVPNEAHHATHFSINENYVPVDFLALVSSALTESYPTPESLSVSGSNTCISPGITEIINSVRGILQAMPQEFISTVVEACQAGLVIWMSDEASVADDTLAQALDQLYLVIVHSYVGVFTRGPELIKPETLDVLLPIYGPRLSRATSSAIPKALQDFFRLFAELDLAALSEDVRDFIVDVNMAVPGMIKLKGLTPPNNAFSDEESQAKFPHALQAVVPAEIQLAPADPSLLAPDPTEAYDADVSQFEQTQVKPLEQVSAPQATTSLPSASKPATGLTTSSSVEMGQVDRSSMAVHPGGDVFGPTASTAARPSKGKGKRKQRRRQSRSAASQSQSPSQAQLGSKDVVIELGDPGLLPETSGESSGDHALPRSASAPAEGTQPLVKSSSSKSSGKDRVRESTPPDVLDTSNEATSPQFVPNSQAVEGISAVTQTAPNVPTGDVSRDNKPSLLNSAKGWFRRVPSFGLFSPTHNRFIANLDELNIPADLSTPAPPLGATQVEQPPANRIEDDLESRTSTQTGSSPSSSPSKGKRPHQEEASSRPSKKGKGKARSRVQDDEHRVSGREGHGTPIKSRIGKDEEEEDELLLSPESAKKRKRGEETSGIPSKSPIASTSQSTVPSSSKRDAGTRGRAAKGGSKKSDDTSIQSFTPTASKSASSSSGPSAGPAAQPAKAGMTSESLHTSSGSSDPLAALIPPSPATRSSQQTKVLSMIEQAAKAQQAVENLDFEGVLSLMRHVDILRNAAQANLERRAEESRAAKRAKRSRKD